MLSNRLTPKTSLTHLKGITMSYLDSIIFAAQHAQDCELPDELLPLVIASEANLLSGHEAGHRGQAAWD